MSYKNSRGFTVLEMVFILVLIGILGVAVVPSTHLVRKQEVKKIAKEISTDISAQRIRAMSASPTGYYVNLIAFTTDGTYNTYEVIPADIKADTAQSKNHDNTKNAHITMTADEGTSTTTLSSIQFDKRGFMQDASKNDITKLTIHIECDDAYADVVINGITGSYAITSK